MRDIDLVINRYDKEALIITQSKPFRRLRNKTQVFLYPTNDHICTRMEHTILVAAISRLICEGINQRACKKILDEKLAYAIGLGHDLGHAPFGHVGERVLNKILKEKDTLKNNTRLQERDQSYFKHACQSVRVINHLCNLTYSKKGLELSNEVKDGIRFHTGGEDSFAIPYNGPERNLESPELQGNPRTLEGCVVRFADEIAFIGRDLEDAIGADFITEDEVLGLFKECSTQKLFRLFNPLWKKIKSIQGNQKDAIITHERITGCFLKNILKNSSIEKIGFSKDWGLEINSIYDFMKKKIWENELMRVNGKQFEQIILRFFSELEDLLEKYQLDYGKYDFNSRNKSIKSEFGKYLYNVGEFYKGEKASAIVTDYVAGMTDRYALEWYQKITGERRAISEIEFQ